jgi:hypothetical protein
VSDCISVTYFLFYKISQIAGVTGVSAQFEHRFTFTCNNVCSRNVEYMSFYQYGGSKVILYKFALQGQWECQMNDMYFQGWNLHPCYSQILFPIHLRSLTNFMYVLWKSLIDRFIITLSSLKLGLGLGCLTPLNISLGCTLNIQKAIQLYWGLSFIKQNSFITEANQKSNSMNCQFSHAVLEWVGMSECRCSTYRLAAILLFLLFLSL